eukprot:1117101-Amphidinium_carterae.1
MSGKKKTVNTDGIGCYFGFGRHHRRSTPRMVTLALALGESFDTAELRLGAPTGILRPIPAGGYFGIPFKCFALFLNRPGRTTSCRTG